MFTLAGLDASYGEVRVLHDISLQLARGEIVGVLGRNGAGKTSLLKAIMGLLPPRAGSVQLHGRELAGLPAHRIAPLGISYVPQGRGLFPWLSVRENLQMGLLVRDAGEDTLAWVLSLFPVLRERLRQRAGTLSGGQQQMLATARALCAKPDLLLLDEPSEGLQPSLVDTLLETVAGLAREGVAVILVEQKVEAVLRVATRVLFLENGALCHASTPAALQSDPSPLARYVGVRGAPG